MAGDRIGDAPPLIAAQGLTRRYGRGAGAVTALRDASLTIRAGEFIAVMGPSGSGKSTLMNLIGLLDRPTGGRLVFRGRDTAELGPDGLARLRGRHVGFVFQSYHLLPRLSALENVALPLVYRGQRARVRRALATAALDRVGLGGHVARRPADLSGGEQQRVAIARALAADPDLVVADEPTGALDSATGGQILDLLEGLCGEGRAVVLVTHDPAVAVRASRLVLIHDGRILRDGPLPLAGRGLRAAS